MQKRHKNCWLTLIVRQAALLAMLVWALLPVGLMPARDGAGNLTFALCSGDGPVLVSLAADGSFAPAPAPEPTGGHEKQSCPFGAAHVASAAPFSTVVLPVAPVTPARKAWFAAASVVREPAHLRPAPRGPPILS